MTISFKLQDGLKLFERCLEKVKLMVVRNSNFEISSAFACTFFTSIATFKNGCEVQNEKGRQQELKREGQNILNPHPPPH